MNFSLYNKNSEVLSQTYRYKYNWTYLYRSLRDVQLYQHSISSYLIHCAFRHEHQFTRHKSVLRAIKCVWNITVIETHASKKISFVVLMFLHYMQIAILTVEKGRGINNIMGIFYYFKNTSLIRNCLRKIADSHMKDKEGLIQNVR